MPSFVGPEFDRVAARLVASFKTAAAIVLDLRDNGGGDGPTSLAAMLHTTPYHYHADSTPIRIGILNATDRASVPEFERFRDAHLSFREPETMPAPDAYRGVLAVLANRVTCSAAESFLLSLVRNNRARVVGEHTAGSAGRPFRHVFENGSHLSVGTSKVVMPDGSRFEGRGIPPHIAASPTRGDLYAGTDAVLDAAIADARARV